MKKTLIIPGMALFVAFLWLAFGLATPPKPWPVPDAHKNKKNPVAANAASIKNGQSLYNLHCASCHGKKGKGDGPKAANLKTDSGDFTLESFHKQTDGELFYKTVEGRDDMPSFKKKLSDPNDVWDVVNFMRTLK